MGKVKSIEDMARDYQRSDYSDGTSATAFEHGAEWMRMVLTSWHDPKVELPENDREVLCIIDSWTSTFMVLKHNDLGWWMHPPHYYGWCSCCFNVLGWRNIHEHRSEKGGEK